MTKVLLLSPRLDISFKYNSAIKKIPEKGPITIPIRKHWEDFINCIEQEYQSRTNVDFIKIELPLWQFNQKVIDQHGPDLVFVPHKEHHNFSVKNCQALYYMQTTFPWIFSIDSKGWAGGASVYPYSSLYKDNYDKSIFENFKTYASENRSKYLQPTFNNLTLPENFVLFTCQIPHDETIKYHSKVGVGDALIWTCEATKKLDMPLVVKGHPVSKDSMIGLKNSLVKYKHVTYIDNASIHQLISLSKCLVTVNSGTGMEALLHGKPVITFGRAEYDCVTNHANKTNIADILENLHYDEINVAKFFDGWYNWCYDTKNIETFKKLQWSG
jgi:hypothetical protein